MPVDVDIVMPVYNEAGNIAAVLAEIARCVPICKRVLVVYDFDEDDTLPVFRAIASSYPWAQLVKNQLGAGVLNAIRSGIAATMAPSS